MVLIAVRRSGCALQFSAPALRQDPEVVEAAVAQDPRAIRFADYKVQAEFGILDLMVAGRARHLERFRSSPAGSDTSQEPSSRDEIQEEKQDGPVLGGSSPSHSKRHIAKQQVGPAIHFQQSVKAWENAHAMLAGAEEETDADQEGRRTFVPESEERSDKAAGRPVPVPEPPLLGLGRPLGLGAWNFAQRPWNPSPAPLRTSW